MPLTPSYRTRSNLANVNVRKVLTHATVVVAILLAVFYQDIQKRHSSVDGVPTTGAEDASLVSLRTKNPSTFSAFVALGLISPHALSACFAAAGGEEERRRLRTLLTPTHPLPPAAQ